MDLPAMIGYSLVISFSHYCREGGGSCRRTPIRGYLGLLLAQ